MNDNNAKPITDKPITVRIPLDLLEAIETKASDRYPSRKGTGGNRSQVILDALVFYQSHQWGEGENSVQSTQGTQEVIRDEVKKQLSDNVHDVIQETVHKELQSITGNLEYLIDKALEKKLQSTQSNNSVKAIQSVQSNTNEDDGKIQSTQDNTENNSSEDSLQSGLNENQVSETIEEVTPVKEAISEDNPDPPLGDIPENPTTTGIEDNGDDEEIEKAIEDAKPKKQKKLKMTKDEIKTAIANKDLDTLNQLNMTCKRTALNVLAEDADKWLEDYFKEKGIFEEGSTLKNQIRQITEEKADPTIKAYCES